MVAAGLNWTWVESLPERTLALQQAESDWKAMRVSRGKARQAWNREAPQLIRLRADRMSHLLSDVSTDSTYSQTKKKRDEAYTDLKEAVSLIRKTGRYVFWKDPKRLAGFSSQYTRQHRVRKKN